MERAIYLITGLMAAGKSTLAELLATRLENSVHLRGDIFRKMIVNGRVEMSAQPPPEACRQLHLRYELAAQAAKTYYDHGFSVVMQDNYYGEALPRMQDLLRGYPLQIIVLCPDYATLERREQLRNKTGYQGFDLAALWADFMRATPPLGLWLDTSQQTPEQSLAAILAHFDQSIDSPTA